MGYFSNGAEGDSYEEKYCSRCVHGDHENGCPVMIAHLLYNYDDCNKPESILHILIPCSANKPYNERCSMFINKNDPHNA